MRLESLIGEAEVIQRDKRVLIDEIGALSNQLEAQQPNAP